MKNSTTRISCFGSLVIFAVVIAGCGAPDKTDVIENRKEAPGVTNKEVDPLYTWLQYSDAGLELRAIVTDGSNCPEPEVDGVAAKMTVRVMADNVGFPVSTCGATVAATARSISVSGKTLPSPTTTPKRILILGDTGCRMTSGWYENCDGKGTGVPWSFLPAARAAAAEKPDLIVHVGDYVYREAKCDTAKQPGCAGSPWGDNWDTWDTDFFKPSLPLLDVAPWIVTRGNHEDCGRNHLGWLRFLDGRAITAADLTTAGCPQFSEPYKVAVGAVDFLVLNTTTDPKTPGAASRYLDDFNKAAGMVTPGRPAWTVTHRPFWALGPNWKDPTELYVTDTDLQHAIASLPGGGWPAEVQMALAGHIHLLQTLSFPDGRPHQVVSGDAGTAQDAAITARAIASNPQAFSQLGITPADFESYHDFGYVLLDVAATGGWTVTVKDLAGDVLEQFHLD